MMTVFKRGADPACEMGDGVKLFYNQGQNSSRDDKNPYNRKTRIMQFYAWSAGYCDKWGDLPREA